MKHTDPAGHGVEAFFPRCFHLKSGEGCDDFLHDYYFTEAEVLLKKFVNSYERAGNNLLDAIDKGKITCKEHLLICCNMIRKKLQNADDNIDKNKGYRGTMRLNPGEWNCLKRGGVESASFNSFVQK